MAWFRKVSRQKVANTALADKLHAATAASLEKYAAIVADTPHWQQLRDRARQVKLHTLTHLDRYLDRFVQAAQANNATVFWADTGDDACEYVVDLARRRGVTRVTKAKSMTGEEIEINHALASAGVEPVETDLGEMICQLAGDTPSHVTAPIIHWSMEEVARLLKEKGVIAEMPAELSRDNAPDPRAPDPRAPDPRAPDPRAPDLGRGLLPQERRHRRCTSCPTRHLPVHRLSNARRPTRGPL